jgi:hypothetical protein
LQQSLQRATTRAASAMHNAVYSLVAVASDMARPSGLKLEISEEDEPQERAHGAAKL